MILVIKLKTLFLQRRKRGSLKEIVGKLSNQKLGGITGDVLGATAFISELAFLFGLVIYLSGLI